MCWRGTSVGPTGGLDLMHEDQRFQRCCLCGWQHHLQSWGSMEQGSGGEDCGKLEVVLGCGKCELLAGPAGRGVQRPLRTVGGHQRRDGMKAFCRFQTLPGPTAPEGLGASWVRGFQGYHPCPAFKMSSQLSSFSQVRESKTKVSWLI